MSSLSAMRTTAAVCTQFNAPLQLAELDLDAPGPTEVVVRMMASGVCQTDVSLRSGALPVELPMVLGHEGAGIVESVGAQVTRVRPGDHVVLSWVPQCGKCYFCTHGQPHLCEPGSRAIAVHGVTDGQTRLRLNGQAVRQLSGLGTFSSLAVVMQDAVVPIASDIPFEVAALVGCAVLTGFGAAVNTASIHTGDAVAIIGCGGVGLNVIQGSRIAGAEVIIAIDGNPAAQAAAAGAGATHVLGPGDQAHAKVLELTDGRGADVVFDVVGRPEVLTTALSLTRRGGQMVVVGMARLEERWEISPMAQFVGAERRILGCRYGSCDINRDVPRILDHYRRGELTLASRIAGTVALDRVNDVMDHALAPTAGRTLLSFQ